MVAAGSRARVEKSADDDTMLREVERKRTEAGVLKIVHEQEE